MDKKRRTMFRYFATDRYIVAVPHSETTMAASSQDFEPQPASLSLHGGVYDIGRSAELSEQLDSIEPHSDVVIDLSFTEYFDCSSIGILIAKSKAWSRQKPGTRIHLRNVNSRLARVLLTLGLQNAFVLERTAVSPFDRGTSAG